MQVRKHRVLALFAVLAVAACSGDTGTKGEKGDTGTQGAKGDTGATGSQGPAGGSGEAPLATSEGCAGCHGATLASKHMLSDQLGVQVTAGPARPAAEGGGYDPSKAVSVSGTDVLVKFNVKVNGAPRFDFIYKAADLRNHNEDAFWVYNANASCPPLTGCQAAPNDSGPAGIRTKLGPTQNPPTTWTIAGSQAGDYTATIKGMPLPLAQGTKFMLSIMNASGVTATVVATYGTSTHDVVSDQACINCHGFLTRGGEAHDVTVPQGVGPCIVCHNRMGAADPRLPGAGSGLMGIVHGIHNSANMPDGQYTFTWTNGNKFNFSKGFPGNMNNCATCHDSQARLDAVKNAKVSYALCISCHDSWDGFSNTTPNGSLAFHQSFTPTSTVDCSFCHNGTTARATIADFHNGQITERAGLIWDGADQSVVLGPTIKMAITGVTVTTSDVKVTWTAKDDKGVAYNPCNQDFAVGPVFFGAAGSGSSEGCTNTKVGCASNMSMLRAYAQADDWVNDNYPGGSNPGQPRSTNLDSKNTTCSSGVATTVLPLQATGATRGIVALQGKPQVKWAPTGNIIWVRSQTPTREFVVSSGALPAEIRRQIVSVDKCNACHLGTLYQHGGSRVDKIELCVMCHNPASSEQNNRVGMGVDASDAYDGKAGETYDLRTMVHAIHAAGETGAPLMYYRSNGVFFFGAKDASGNLLGARNWPKEADCVKCVDAEDGPLTYCKVYGSSATGYDYSKARNADGSCKDQESLPNSTSGTWRPHRVIEVHYPRPLNDCAACHFTYKELAKNAADAPAGTTADALPDPNKAVAVTFDAGATPWNNLLDDLLIGPSTASCMSCHQKSDSVEQYFLRKHAYDNSWWPSVFPNGRQTLLDAAP